MKTVSVLIVIVLLFTGCASLKPHPKPWTPTEKKYAAFNMLGIMADAYTTKQMLNNPNSYELNPGLGEQPSDSQLAIYFPLTAIITLGLSHFYPKLREPLLFGYGGLSFGAAVHNQNLD